MNEFRITKYNPKYRKDDKYLIDDWTSFYDIGNVFNGRLFTIQDYEVVENDYINIILVLMEAVGIDCLQITSFENYKKTKWKEMQRINKNQIRQFIMDVLRDKCWGKLDGLNFFVHFGYDLYMYVGLNLEFREIEEIALNTRLFVESMNSPYHI